MSRRLFGKSVQGVGLSVAALAPMVDVLTILLVAILRTWNADPPIPPTEEGFVLPVSVEETAPEHGVVIEVGTNGLYVNGWRAGSSSWWTQAEALRIEGVYEALQGVGGNTAIVRAHRDAPWTLVSKVLFTAQQAGYGEVQLVAVSRASL